ncbi:env protein [Brown greater galago prosimian foamy virus]|uniref:Envelope glycoprotein gp130 n=1 Tax=Brown greater galago prosimian foamy virus TaxID=2170139 RepID=A0A088F613_9RETR|nr:env protein [Brown greater galago prosimian foamy virus]AIM40343.1 env protein [Brown greater galago prosimian foamy virus]
MEEPMTLQQWLRWRNMNLLNKADQLQRKVQQTPTLTKSETLEEIVDIEPPVYDSTTEPLPYTRMDLIRFRLYRLCATTTRTMGWCIGLFCLLLILLFSLVIVILRLQWRNAIVTPGPIIAWNESHEAVLTTRPNYTAARSRRSVEPALPVDIEINITALPQGMLLVPHTKPVVKKERALGFSQIIIMSSDSMANSMGLKKEDIHLLVDLLNEEMEQLQNIILEFDLPIGDPHDQSYYIEQRCKAALQHCYVVEREGKGWPTDGAILDQCPLPDITKWNPYQTHAIWDYYLQPPAFVKKTWNSSQVYGNVRMGSFYTKGNGFQNTSQYVIFCSDQLYGSWYYKNDVTQQMRDQTLMLKLRNLTMSNTSHAQLKDRALPPDWTTQGQNRLFRSITTFDVCQRPEMVFLLNTTYYTYSLWEGDCNITSTNVSLHPSCKHFNKSTNRHPYACRHWGLYFGEEKTLCYSDSEDRCSYFPSYYGREALNDFGYLAFTDMFPAPTCIETKEVRKPQYKVYSAFQECMIKSQQYDINDVIAKLEALFTPLQGRPQNRAFMISSTGMPEEYKEKPIKVQRSCLTSRKRRDTNFHKIQSIGFNLANAISTVSKISDLNDNQLAKGMHVLRNHLVTLMEATLHDISKFESGLALQHLHTHLAQLRSTLQENRVDWSILDTAWIQSELNTDDNTMKLIKRTAKAMVHHVQQTQKSLRATTREVGIYFEIIIPAAIYTQNWQPLNLGHLVFNSGQLTQVFVEQPYNLVSMECNIPTYLHIEECVNQDYLICDIVEEVLPCGNQTGSDCPVMAKAVKAPFVSITPLKNGSYVILADTSACTIPAYSPVLVTTNDTLQCYGHILKRPLKNHKDLPAVTIYEPRVPDLVIRLPHLVGVIAQLKDLKFQVTSSWESIKDQIARSKELLLQLDLHEGSAPEWINRLAAAAADIWPATGQALKGLGDFLQSTVGSLLGTGLSFLSYLKPILIGIGLIFLVVILFKIISWLPGTRDKRE